MTPGMIVFLLIAAGAVAAAVGMLYSRNSIYSALFLVLNFALVAVLYLSLSAPFIALVQVTVYAGAIMVLFLFVIMLLGAERLSEGEVLPWQRPLAFGLGALFLAGVFFLNVFQAGLTQAMPAVDSNFGSPEQIGATLYQAYVLPFEITSVLLLIALIGAVALTRIGGKERGQVVHEQKEEPAVKANQILK